MFSLLHSAYSVVSCQGNIKARKVADNSAANNMLYTDEAKLPLLQQLQIRESEKNPATRKITSHTNSSIEDEKGDAIKVKILMTKEEAATLTSKFKDGGVLKFKDVARELVQIPADRVTVVASSLGTNTITDRLAKELY